MEDCLCFGEWQKAVAFVNIRNEEFPLSERCVYVCAYENTLLLLRRPDRPLAVCAGGEGKLTSCLLSVR